MRYRNILTISLSTMVAALIMQSGCITHNHSEKNTLSLDESKIAEIQAAVGERIQEGDIPGGVLRIHIESPMPSLQQRGAVREWTEVFGDRAQDPKLEKNTADTIYDLASLTKVTATAPSIMLLYERGLLDVEAPASRYLPLFTNAPQQAITVRHLLTHTSGLRPGISYKGWSGYEAGIETACKELPRKEPGTDVVYSDINFILLGEIVRTVSGKRIDEFAKENIYIPLKMKDTGYNPPLSKLTRIAPTEEDGEGGYFRGIVHDPTSRTMGGVAGHAGVFSTIHDLGIYCDMLLHEGRYGKRLEKQLFKPETVRLMATVQSPEIVEDKRSLGWDVDTGYSSPRGNIFTPRESFGHSGFTGTSLWILPKERTYYIFLSNRLHPNGRGNVLGFQRILGTKVAEMKGLQLPESEK